MATCTPTNLSVPREVMSSSLLSKSHEVLCVRFLRSLSVAITNIVMRDRFSSTCQPSRQTTL